MDVYPTLDPAEGEVLDRKLVVTVDAFIDRDLSSGEEVWVTFPRERVHPC